ncbi:DinB family protein [Lewinella sp. JB7]|uniref:DinB family protein n=1 Tax=Lewinella sp. JB7 TaxID=2962887 RepID=UPI0020CA2648|nr:DinB family protein [Lewinella sp. JB7]MCP9234683.1 DinB family protein [Lewinella sp. JB7]
MTYPSTFAPDTLRNNVNRIHQLSPQTKPRWGKMNAAQMLAHLNVAYDMETGALPVRNNFLMRFFLKAFVKRGVVGPDPYPRNSRTAPQFVIADKRDFERERAKLIAHLERVSAEGEAAYEGKENVSFGPMTAQEWSVMYQKHLDHHLGQFGV